MLLGWGLGPDLRCEVVAMYHLGYMIRGSECDFLVEPGEGGASEKCVPSRCYEQGPWAGGWGSGCGLSLPLSIGGSSIHSQTCPNDALCPESYLTWSCPCNFSLQYILRSAGEAQGTAGGGGCAGVQGRRELLSES